MVEKARVVTNTTPIDNKSTKELKLDQDYEAVLHLLSNGKTLEILAQERKQAHIKLSADDDDPDFLNVLSCLKECGNAYLLEDRIDGFLTITKYEEQDEEYSSEREIDQERKRKVRSGSRKENGLSNFSERVEIQSGNLSISNSGNKGGIFSGDEFGDQEEVNTCSEKECDEEPKRKLRSASKKKNGVSKLSVNGSRLNSGDKGGIFSGCEKAVDFGKDGMEADSDYYRFIKNCKVADDGSLVYKYKGYEVVYCKKDVEEVKYDGNDSDSTDCEIIDSVEYYKQVNVNEDECMDGEVVGDFKRKLIANLKRPYDQEEYNRLWGDISFRKLKLHHKELRKGRELSCVTDTAGKSYLEYFPDLKKKFNESHDDKPKRLILLRGFFFWLENQVQDGSFKPWKDDECLSVNPGSC